MKNKGFLLFTGLLALVLTASGPARAESDRACTAMWCVEGYTLNLQAPDWPAGEYTFNIIADNKVHSCRARLPFRGCAAPFATCSDEGVRIGESGCALLPAAHMFSTITMQEIPSEISVTIGAPDGRSFIYESKVQAQCGYPNGADCDPRQCCSAVEAVTVRWD